MYTSFFKREPRTNSTLPIHRISNAISENKRGGERERNVHVNTGKRVCIPRSLSVNRELTVRCQYTEFQTQSVKINMEEKERETGVFKTRNGEMTEWHLTMWDTVNPYNY